MKTAKRTVPVFSTEGDYIIGEIDCGQKTMVLGEIQEGMVIAYILGLVKQRHGEELIEDELWERAVSEKNRLICLAKKNIGSNNSGYFKDYLAKRETEGKNLYDVCTCIDKTDIKGGDLIFDSDNCCMGVYMGDGSAIVERKSGDIVRKDIRELKSSRYGRPKHSDWDEEEVFFGRRLKRLRECMIGDDVWKIQETLRSLGYYGGRCDGIYNRLTKKAVRKFKKANGLEADGVVDYCTWSSMMRR